MKFISPNFFSASNAFWGTIMTYSVFATAFFMRPFGAYVAGYLGDRHGRRSGLLFSVTMMAIPTFCIGLLPTYDQIGYVAPLLLVSCRLLQGISLGGEFTGSVVYLMEQAPENKRAAYGSWADLGSSLGLIGASLTVMVLNSLLTESQMVSWGWRIPFLLSLFLGFVGYYLRSTLTEPQIYQQLKESEKIRHPLREIMALGKKRFVLNTLFLAINSAGYYFLIIFLPQQETARTLGLTNILPLISLVCMIPAYLLGARVADRWGSIPCLSVGYLTTLVAIPPLIYAHSLSNKIGIIVMHVVFTWTLGLCFGPRSRFMMDFYPVAIRYSALSLTYNIANAIFGGLSPLICALLVQLTGNLIAAGIFVGVMTMVSLGAVKGLRKIPSL